MNEKKILLETIFNKTGIYITKKNDCRLISQLIAKEKVGFLSESTLYRFFLNKELVNRPYTNTYNVLAKFCGFTSWDSFLIYCDSNYLFNESGFLINTIDVIINEFIKNNNFEPLIAIFESLENQNYKIKEFVGLRTFMCFQNTTNFPLFIKKYGSHPFVREILIEALYDPKHRINGYNKSLEYFLEWSDPESETYLQDFIFVNAVLYRSYYLIDDSKSFSFAKKLYENEIDEISFEAVHIFPKSRFYAYKIWYLLSINSTSIQIEEYLDFLTSWIEKQFNLLYSILELNIILQTFTEVAERQKLNGFVTKIYGLYQNRIKKINNSNSELQFVNNANGLLNLIP
jgi:hypothetical protein